MIGRLLDGRYKILQVLGAGGFSETYLAQDTRRPGSPTCVVKLLKPNTNNPNSLQISRRLFQSEAETLERLGNHSQIPRLLAYFEEDQEFYLVQEYIKGNLLSTEFTPETPYSEAQTIQLLRDVLLTLAFVHEQGVIHRDVKPDNLIRRWEDDKLVLVDFGAVKKIWNRNAAQNQVAGTIIGTPGYMATEQGRGKPRPSSDIYALGMVAVQAITGITPMSLQEDSETGETIWQQYAKASPGLVAIIDKMIRYHFRDRFQSAKDVLAALDQLTNAAPGFMPNLNAAQPVLEEEEEETAPAHREETFYGQPFVPPTQPPTFLVSEEPPAAPRDATVFIPTPASAETSAANPSTFLAESLPVPAQTSSSAQPPTVLSTEEPTLSQLYPPPPAPQPLPPQMPPAPPKVAVTEAPQKTASKAPLLAGAGVLAALLVGTIGFFALKPSSPTVAPSPVPSGESTSPSTNGTVPESSAVKPGESTSTSTATIEKPAVLPSTAKPVVQPPTATAVKPIVPAPTTTAVKPIVPAPTAAEEKPIVPSPKPAVAAVTPPKKVAIQSPPPPPRIKSEEPEKKPRKKPVVAVRTPEISEPPKKVAIKPAQKPPTPAEKKPTVVLRPVRAEGAPSPFKSQSTPVNTAPSDGLKPATAPVQPPN
jgi:serine/threonine protein kinase